MASRDQGLRRVRYVTATVAAAAVAGSVGAAALAHSATADAAVATSTTVLSDDDGSGADLGSDDWGRAPALGSGSAAPQARSGGS